MADLQKMGIQCSRPRTARFMRELGLRAKTARKFRVTKTYVRTGTGWLYLTVMLDLFNREIVGYSFSRSLTAKTTVIPALDMAVINRAPAEGLIVHSDHWTAFPAMKFIELKAMQSRPKPAEVGQE